MSAQEQNLEVIANNVANINTTGFKRSRAEFTDLIYQTERLMGVANRGRDATIPEGAQIGLGVTASSLVSQGLDSMTTIQAELGSTQSAVTSANNSMSSQLTVLQEQVGNLDDVNPNATAAQINSLTDQIQMAYELTSRLQQLNLAQYLPVP
jgi:flagellin-like hook-associated protein FlgL